MGEREEMPVEVEVLKFITPPMYRAEKERFASAGIQEVTGSRGAQHGALHDGMHQFPEHVEGAVINDIRAAVHRQTTLTDPGTQAPHLQLCTGRRRGRRTETVEAWQADDEIPA